MSEYPGVYPAPDKVLYITTEGVVVSNIASGLEWGESLLSS